MIDFSSNVVVESALDGKPNTASGVFGIGIMVLPNAAGVKKFTTECFAQGCGIAGIGALFLNGEAHLTGEHYVQGCGAFGVGILKNSRGHKSTTTAARQGQGLGMTQGVGIFSHAGDNADIKGGLVDPDPREPLGSVANLVAG